VNTYVKCVIYIYICVRYKLLSYKFFNLLNKREFVYFIPPSIHLAHPTKHYTRANNHQSIHLHIIFLILFFVKLDVKNKNLCVLKLIPFHLFNESHCPHHGRTQLTRTPCDMKPRRLQCCKLITGTSLPSSNDGTGMSFYISK